MKNNNIILILGIFLMVMGVGMIIAGYILNEEGTIGDCYDKHNNKIIGQQCELEFSKDAKLFLMSGFMVFLMGFVLGISGMIDGLSEKTNW